MFDFLKTTQRYSLHTHPLKDNGTGELEGNTDHSTVDGVARRLFR
jgi:hypothetical protein